MNKNAAQKNCNFTERKYDDYDYDHNDDKDGDDGDDYHNDENKKKKKLESIHCIQKMRELYFRLGVCFKRSQYHFFEKPLETLLCPQFGWRYGNRGF